MRKNIYIGFTILLAGFAFFVGLASFFNFFSNSKLAKKNIEYVENNSKVCDKTFLIQEQKYILKANFFFSSLENITSENATPPFYETKTNTEKIFLYKIPSDVQEVLNKKKTSYQNEPNFFDDEEPEILSKKIVDAMTNEELLAQCFMFGWAGQSPNARVADWVDMGLGGIKIFGWNTADSKLLSQSILDLQTRALLSRFSIPLFVATDQEGGRVRHVRGLTTITPSALACGASGIPMDAFYSGYYISKELATIGINLNFAPTADLYSNYGSSVIVSRSFGDNAENVAKLVTAFSDGVRAAGVLSTAKHFPGHGDTSLDSHGYLPRINISKKTFLERELVPFRALIESGVPFIMSGHLNFPQFMKTNEPATFSYNILTELLRNKLGFSGLIVTDDMMMLSALNYAGNFSQAITLALKAGNNIIESSSTPALSDSVWRNNIALMKSDTKFFNTVKTSAEKIILQKLCYFKSETSVNILPEPNKIFEKFPIAGANPFFQSFAARAITPIKSANESEESCVKIFREDKVLFAGDFFNFLQLAEKNFPNAKAVNISQLYYSLYNYEKIVFCIYDKFSNEAFKALQKNFPNKKYFVISAISPVYLNDVKAETILAIYDYSDFSFLASFAYLRGEFMPTGKLPLERLKF